ncbi:hypothetical protein D2N39_12570 [Gemmobacter lutimaris]|uniref:Uncharacterized protein n=1 Tax=Gemmobacter lutimaris TaxID=2306023 RepID=A0A398BRK2_9RHOB|nr:hypothetical protein [Gemmobacter lutimaris]RID91531.1 hypothetical protein D2N39_12570 [Gemmobacter lutimaris]
MGFRSIGSIAAQLVAVTRRDDIPVGDCTATVLVAEGAAQLIWHRGVAGPLAGNALFNDFLAPGMGAQLRQLADAVDAAQALIEPNGGFK